MYGRTRHSRTNMNILLLNNPDKDSPTWQAGEDFFDNLEPKAERRYSRHTYQNRDTLDMALDYHDGVVVNDLGGANWLDGSQLLYHKTVNLSDLKDFEDVERIFC